MGKKFPAYPPTQAARSTRCPILLGFRDGNPARTPTCDPTPDTTRNPTRRKPSKIGLFRASCVGCVGCVGGGSRENSGNGRDHRRASSHQRN